MQVPPEARGFPRGSVAKNLPANAGDTGLILWSGRRRKWQPTPVFLPEKSHGQRSLEGYSPSVHKKSDTLSKQADTTRGRSRNTARYRDTDNLSQNMYHPHQRALV